MKRSIAIIILLFVCGIVAAQTTWQPGNNVTIRICTPGRAQMMSKPPLWVIFLQDKMIYKGDADAKALNPNDIEAINVLKDSSAIIKYGKVAQYGVIELRLKSGTKLDTTQLKPAGTRLFKN
ncbi:hypothetical protein BEL04_17025 [Mucilaginibacter sp. PPCGB 2223]|uniref:hypothetical protein n=1 Tax=Mucilaginibacter sp. PPCGB 2223 TaxID=1886027 RepID=UPI0008252BDA|nr:hypothetical protein [Mucilaginibacter sp. PPCGB 2223]OCX51718.1 hypothetical protein BEL04_17025 [Mucilaginibacter sp. PPCGB 2223]